MHAVIMNETGGPEVLTYGEIATPEPAPGEVRIRVAYAGVNPADWKNRQGMLAAFRPYVFPYVLGFDAAGVVDALGEGVTGFAVGDRVFTPTNHGQGAQGSYAELVVANVDRVAPIPDAMDFRSAAALPVAALTAWQALQHNGGVQPGQQVLVHGGSGGLGGFAVQFAKAAGAQVAATCSTANVAYLAGLGADLVIDYVSDDVTATLKEWAPEGLDLVVNTRRRQLADARARPGPQWRCPREHPDAGRRRRHPCRGRRRGGPRCRAGLLDDDRRRLRARARDDRGPGGRGRRTAPGDPGVRPAGQIGRAHV